MWNISSVSFPFPAFLLDAEWKHLRLKSICPWFHYLANCSIHMWCLWSARMTVVFLNDTSSSITTPPQLSCSQQRIYMDGVWTFDPPCCAHFMSALPKATADENAMNRCLACAMLASMLRSCSIRTESSSITAAKRGPFRVAGGCSTTSIWSNLGTVIVSIEPLKITVTGTETFSKGSNNSAPHLAKSRQSLRQSSSTLSAQMRKQSQHPVFHLSNPGAGPDCH